MEEEESEVQNRSTPKEPSNVFLARNGKWARDLGSCSDGGTVDGLVWTG